MNGLLLCALNLAYADAKLALKPEQRTGILVESNTAHLANSPMHVKLMPPELPNDVRYAYKKQLVIEALEITRDTFGPYLLEVRKGYIRNVRAFRELEIGDTINTLFALTTAEREASAIPIRIPIRKGLLNYRLLVTKKDRLASFNGVNTVAQLKAKTVGMPVNWQTAEVFKRLGFDVVSAQSRPGLYSMLSRDRFDYIILGVNEVYKEMAVYEFDKKGFVVVPDLAIYINIPLFVFVSNNEPAIANRIELGLQKLVASGKFEALFNAEYLEIIRKANLTERDIIVVDNARSPETGKAIDTKLWLDLNNPAYQSKPQ